MMVSAQTLVLEVAFCESPMCSVKRLSVGFDTNAQLLQHPMVIFISRSALPLSVAIERRRECQSRRYLASNK